MIFSKIIASKEGCDISELLAEYKVPLGAIYEDLESINDLLMSKDMEILEISQSGKIVFKGEWDQAANILDEVSLYNQSLSKKERRMIMSLKLLASDGYVEIGEMATILEASRTTVMGESLEVERILATMKMALSIRPNKGMIALGEEKERRIGILSILSEILEKYGAENNYLPCQIAVTSIFDTEGLLDTIEEILTTVENNQNIHLTDRSFNKIAKYLAIAAKRMLGGHYISATEFVKGKKYEFANEVLNRMHINFNIALYDGEVQLLESFLNNASFVREQAANPREMARLGKITRLFIRNVSNDLNIDLTRNYTLKDTMMSHIGALAEKATDEIKDAYLLDFLNNRFDNVLRSAGKNIKDIEVFLKRSLDESEKADMAIHLCAGIERKRHESNKVNVLVVCGTSTGVGYYLAERLKLRFNINIKGLASSHNVHGFIDDNVDLVISTEPLRNMERPWVQVSGILKNEDYPKIQREIDAINSIKPVKNDRSEPFIQLFDAISSSIMTHVEDILLRQVLERKIFAHIRDYLGSYDDYPFFIHELIPPNHIRIDVKCDNSEEAIKLSAEPLLKSGFITESYLREMIRINQMDNGESFVIGDGFAAPYVGLDKSVIRTGMSLIRLRDSVKFGNSSHNPVDLVCFMGVNERKNHLKALHNLIQLAQIDDFKRKLRLAKCSEEMNSIIRNYELGLDGTMEAHA
ncbi:MAG: PTS sugar transporter subunit IIA [Deltaproteobacteria bacterium]|jgi:mannitol/fructose-specific phosphotransferase system IIA component (Ntr-type)/transcriptional antiterminator|nr:PTS sugar transporter subunit IIA [Deltaproteobacteria bacterium]